MQFYITISEEEGSLALGCLDSPEFKSKDRTQTALVVSIDSFRCHAQSTCIESDIRLTKAKYRFRQITIKKQQK